MGKIEKQMFWYVAGDISIGDSNGPKLMHITKNHIKTTSIDWHITYSEISEIDKVSEPNTSEVFKRVNASERMKRDGKI